jgi:hypothetical protein
MRAVALIATMAVSRPLRPHVNLQRPAARVPAARVAIGPGRSAKTWRREKRRGIIAAIAVAFVLGASVSVYAVHSQMARTAAYARAIALHTAALETGAALGSGTVLFVPEYGNTCRRRWLDNKTGILREGGELPCDEAVGWNATVPTREQKVERRMDAIRNGFQSRSVGSTE